MTVTRKISILASLLAASLSAFGQTVETVEIVPPAAIGEDLTATWTVIVSNPALLPAAPLELRVDFTRFIPWTAR